MTELLFPSPLLGFITVLMLLKEEVPGFTFFDEGIGDDVAVVTLRMLLGKLLLEIARVLVLLKIDLPLVVDDDVDTNLDALEEELTERPDVDFPLAADDVVTNLDALEEELIERPGVDFPLAADDVVTKPDALEEELIERPGVDFPLGALLPEGIVLMVFLMEEEDCFPFVDDNTLLDD